jgi:hypothetical protein
MRLVGEIVRGDDRVRGPNEALDAKLCVGGGAGGAHLVVGEADVAGGVRVDLHVDGIGPGALDRLLHDRLRLFAREDGCVLLHQRLPPGVDHVDVAEARRRRAVAHGVHLRRLSLAVEELPPSS